MTEPIPAVSVVLPVRNGGAYLTPALDSIFSQQDIPFELIVVDDGSTDGTPALLAAIPDPRLRVLRREGGGLVPALNAGIAAARAPYIARMDADDIALPARLAKQAAILDSRPDVALVHSSVDVIDGTGRSVGRIDAEQISAEARRASLLLERDAVPIVHPTVMMRRDMLDALGGYRLSLHAEDHDLWLRAVGRFPFHAITEPLLQYRHHEGGISRKRTIEQSLSGLVNIATYRIKAARGIDLYADAPVLYAALRAWGSETLGQDLAHLAEARRLRAALKQRQWRAAITGLAQFAPRHARLLPQSGLRRLMHDAWTKLYEHGLSLLDAQSGE